ncbi:MAG: hypothetical protein P8175_17450 [Deltaproteobacteria bacterium]
MRVAARKIIIIAGKHSVRGGAKHYATEGEDVLPPKQGAIAPGSAMP